MVQKSSLPVRTRQPACTTSRLDRRNRYARPSSLFTGAREATTDCSALDQVAQHDEPIRCVKYFEANGQGMLGESSHDAAARGMFAADTRSHLSDRIMGQGAQALAASKHLFASAEGHLSGHLFEQTLKYWDLRTPNPVATVQLPERCYGASDFARRVSRFPDLKKLTRLLPSQPSTWFIRSWSLAQRSDKSRSST